MRKTLCRNCSKIWNETRDIPIEQSVCPNCNTLVLDMLPKHLPKVVVKNE